MIFHTMILHYFKFMKKLFVIQKYVVASSIQEALKIERKVRPDEVWLDEDFKKAHKPALTKPLVGFKKKIT